jgi:hypothetical protein
MTSAPILPSYLGLPFRILVSPFVRFDPESRVTDIMMFNSKNLGALIVHEEPQVKTVEDNRYALTEMTIEETYGFGILNEGQAIAVAKNVSVLPNEFVLPARAIFKPGIGPAGAPFATRPIRCRRQPGAATACGLDRLFARRADVMDVEDCKAVMERKRVWDGRRQGGPGRAEAVARPGGGTGQSGLLLGALAGRCVTAGKFSRRGHTGGPAAGNTSIAAEICI